MSFFNKKSSEFDERDSQGSGKSKGSLLVLLVLLAGFAYLYFFTSLIVPHETTPPIAPAVATEVKQSLPPKPAALLANPATVMTAQPGDAQPAVPPVPAAGAPTAPTAAAPAPVKPVAPAAAPPVAAKPVAPLPAPGPQGVAKPATPPHVPAAPKKEAVVPLKQEETKPVKAAAQKAAAQKAAQATAPKVEPQGGKIPAPEKSAVTKKPAAPKKTALYTIVAGEFPAGEEAAAAEAKLARLGIKPVTRQETNKSKSMHRLFFGAYTDYDVYAAEFAKLRQSAKGAFGVEKDGKYYLYAGSFASKERGENERQALAAKGITLQSQLVILPLSTVRLTAGKFAEKGEAAKTVARMKGAGLAGTVVSLGR